MKILHNIALSVSEESQKKFKELGIELELGFSSFKIEENSDAWSQVKELVNKYDAVDTASTKFTKQELDSSGLLALNSTWHCGYPEPSQDFGYLSETYDLSNYCQECGVGKLQMNSFRFRGEPKWGAKSFLQTNWVFDEYFVLPSVWEKVFKPLNIDCREVLHYKTGKPLSTVVQLAIASSDLSLSDQNLPHETCSSCTRKKYLPITRGFFPRIEGCLGNPLMRMKESFGSGSLSYNPVIVSNNLFETITHLRLKGIAFTPVQS